MDRPALSQIRWRCRRGMLELDVLLNRFLESGYQQLSDEEIAAFLLMLEQEDDLIWDWMLGKETPKEQRIARIVDRIRPPR